MRLRFVAAIFAVGVLWNLMVNYSVVVVVRYDAMRYRYKKGGEQQIPYSDTSKH